MKLVTKAILKTVFPKRKKDVRKYDFGSLLIIGGSKLYTGAPAMAALSAYKVGVDVVTIAAPERAANIIACYAPEIIAYPLRGDYFTLEHLDDLKELEKGKTAVLIGNGLGIKDSTLSTALYYIKNTKLPFVVDASAIHALKDYKADKGKEIIVTPHLGEFFAMTGIKLEGKSIEEKISIVVNEAKKRNLTILLKGSTDIISDGKTVYLNKTGSPYMTKGGTGDTLAGICAGLLARGLDTLTSACAGAYINGKAGEIASKTLKESFMVTDLISSIPKAIK